MAPSDADEYLELDILTWAGHITYNITFRIERKLTKLR